MTETPNVTFKNGKTCPIIGLGTWKSEPGEVSAAVTDAISCGYRHIDCAEAYCNEPEVGLGVSEKIRDGTVTREELFITSKLWATSFRKELVVPAIRRSLKNLGLSYIDLYLIHWPCGLKDGKDLLPTTPDGQVIFNYVDYVDVWEGMEECVELGLAKSIGVSNFNKRQIERVIKMAKIPPANCQIECHPYFSQKKLIKFCFDNDVSVTAYSPLGSPDRQPADVHTGDPTLLEDAKLIEIAKNYGKNPGQILIRYQIQNGVIVVPKSVNKARIESNFQVFDFAISPADMEVLESLNQNFRYIKFDLSSVHKDYPFHDEY